jgi:glycosyltransferase involved in cell wall biosynthesis
MNLVYISEGNIPSPAANSMQVMKMSQALSALVEGFELLTVGDLYSCAFRRGFDFWSWYGVRRPFTITRIPLLLRPSYPFPAQYRNPRFPRFAAAYARLKRPDIVYTRALRIIPLLLCRRLHVVFESHAPADGDALQRRGLVQDHNLLGIVALSPETAEAFSAAGLDAGRLMTAEDGVDLDQFSAQTPAHEARRHLALGPGPLAIYAGHLYEHRGIEEIFEAARMLPGVTFLLIGGWEHDISLRRQQVQRQGLHNVTIAGFVPNARIPLYLHAADVLLMPYCDSESKNGIRSPLKMFEYMAAGRPIIATDVASIRRRLSHGTTAWLIPPGDSRALRDGILHLVQHASVARGLASRARQEVAAHSWDRRAACIVAHLRSWLQAAGRAA